MKIKMFLEMKNAKAQGLYNTDDNSLLVFKGAIFERDIAESFKKHNYIKERNKLFDLGLIKNNILQQDYLFDSPSAAAASIGGRSAAGPLIWKTEDRITLNDYMSRNQGIGDFDFYTYYIGYKENHIDLANDHLMEELHNEFIKEYSIEKIQNLKLEEYALGENNKTNLSYDFEWGKWAKYGSLRGSTSGKFGIYKHSDGDWKDRNHDIIPDPEKFFETMKRELIAFLKIADKDYYDYTDQYYQQTVLQGLGTIKNKFASLYYPEKYCRISAKHILIKIHKKLGYFKSEMWNWDTEYINHFLLYKLRRLYPDLKDENPFTISSSLWNLYTNIDTTEKEVEIKPIVKLEDYESIRKELFMPEPQIDEVLRMLEYKKNIILMGPPGVGKTYSAKKLVQLLGGNKNHIEMIQFHQSYAYEDFVQGFRPDGSGNFIVKDGIFVELCLDAIEHPNEDYYLIIDEINRGNLSKIFGELLLLIEKDKRGKSNAINLSYSSGIEEKFYIPENIYIIGTMNTADRSLSMVDYALRRRFAFFNILPAFGSKKMEEFLLNEGFDKIQIEKIFSQYINLNTFIKTELGDGFQIGHSYFSSSDFDDFDVWYQGIVKYEINPLLKEYWFDDDEKYRQAASLIR